jgi:hypothetical protein
MIQKRRHFFRGCDISKNPKGLVIALHFEVRRQLKSMICKPLLESSCRLESRNKSFSGRSSHVLYLFRTAWEIVLLFARIAIEKIEKDSEVGFSWDIRYISEVKSSQMKWMDWTLTSVLCFLSLSCLIIRHMKSWSHTPDYILLFSPFDVSIFLCRFADECQGRCSSFLPNWLSQNSI